MYVPHCTFYHCLHYELGTRSSQRPGRPGYFKSSEHISAENILFIGSANFRICPKLLQLGKAILMPTRHISSLATLATKQYALGSQ